jgi:hypothetical protein
VRLQTLNRGELSGIVEADQKAAANAVLKIKTGEDTGREAD